MGKTKLLAIRSKKGKGVYSYKKEKKKLLLEHAGMLEGVSYRTFKASQEQEALKWAGVGAVSNVSTETKNVVKQSKEKETKKKADKTLSLSLDSLVADIFALKKKYPKGLFLGDENLDAKNISKKIEKAENEGIIDANGFNDIWNFLGHYDKLELGCRFYIRWAYHGMGATYKGKILKIQKDRVLFKEIYVNGFHSDGEGFYGKEDHIWIIDKEFANEIKKMKLKCGDCVEFEGTEYQYTRINGLTDYSVKEIFDVKQIDDYELPTDGQLHLQAIESLVCETCIFAEQCYGTFCILGEEKRQARVNQLMYMCLSEEEKKEYEKKYQDILAFIEREYNITQEEFQKMNYEEQCKYYDVYYEKVDIEKLK